MSPHQPVAATDWVSFVDGAGETWIFELPFFRSNWNCIFGNGCAGIELDPALTPAQKLVVEIDGGYHDYVVQSDLKRQEHLEAMV